MLARRNSASVAGVVHQKRGDLQTTEREIYDVSMHRNYVFSKKREVICEDKQEFKGYDSAGKKEKKHA